jgi:branched-chain amino acid transport system substrate-binding protein
MRTVALRAVALLASFAVLTACSSAAQDSAQGGSQTTESTSSADGGDSATARDLTVGILWGISGAYAQVTEDFINGVNYGIERHAQQLKDAGIDVELVKADTEGTPNVGVAAYQKLATKDEVDVVLGPLSSNVALAVLPHADTDGVPLIVTGTAPSLSQHGWKSFHRGTYPNEYQTTAMMTYVSTEKGWKSVAIVNQDSEYGNDLRDKSVKFADANGMTVAESIAYEPGTTNFLSIATKAKSANPDGVIVAGLGAESAAVIKQLLDAGFSSDQIASYGGTDADSVNAVVPAQQREGILLVTVFDANAPELKDRQEVKNFVAAYQGEYGSVPQLYATLGALQIEAIIAAALDTTDEITPAKMMTSLDARKPFESIVGELQFSPNNELIMPLYVQAYDAKGDPQPVFTYTGTP